MNDPSAHIKDLETEVAQLSQTLLGRRLELETLKLKASGEWLEPGDRVQCRISGCVLEITTPRVKEAEIYGFDSVVIGVTTVTEDQKYPLYQLGGNWPLHLTDIRRMVANPASALYRRRTANL